MSETLTESQNITVGIFAALIESVILQPTLYWKNALASGIPISFNPRIMYRGTLASCLNECQMLGLQFGVTGYFQKFFMSFGHSSQSGHFQHDTLKNDKYKEIIELASSSLGGLLPSILTCPIELV